MKRIDLNADLGESFGRWRIVDDEELLSYVSSANVACGSHAGDPVIMDKTVRVCAEKRVAIGAHPGFPDLQGFGRRNMGMTPAEIEALVMYQVGALRAFVQSCGQRLSHVKPHGALYNMAAVDLEIASAVARGVARSTPPGEHTILVGLAGSESLAAASRIGLQVAAEGFCDRAYRENGTLVDRNVPGAVLHDPASVAVRAVSMVTEGTVVSVENTLLNLPLDTICIHSDTPGAPQIAKAVCSALCEAGIAVQPLGTQAFGRVSGGTNIPHARG